MQPSQCSLAVCLFSKHFKTFAKQPLDNRPVEQRPTPTAHPINKSSHAGTKTGEWSSFDTPARRPDV